jgi:copper(I)-binding protein
MKIGNLTLPAGDYTVLHTMDGENHVMVFRQDKGARAEFKVKCTLVPLTAKAQQTQKVYVINAANERELHELIFQGDKAKHVF